MKHSLLGPLTLLITIGIFAMSSISLYGQNIGWGSLTLNTDGESIFNGSNNDVNGTSVLNGTSLASSVDVINVTENEGSTYVECDAQSMTDGSTTTIYSDTTSTDLYANFNWTPPGMGTYDVSCYADYSGQYANGEVNTANIIFQVTGPTAIAYPAYQVTSIIYSPPGNESSAGYTSSTTDGSSNSIGSNFSNGASTSFSIGTTFLGFGSTLNETFGVAQTSGQSNEFTETYTNAKGISLSTSSSGSNTINHDQDYFIIWLNPAISITPTGPDSTNYSIGTQGNGSTSQIVDQVGITAKDMIGSGGSSSIPIRYLEHQPDGNNELDLPGLASICKNLNTAEYNSNSCTLADQCGCKPSDFSAILAQDPLLNYSATENPLQADVSGVTECSSPNSSEDCRYIPVPISSGETQQMTVSLSGPECNGCDTPVNSYTQSDSTATSLTYSGSISNTVNFTWNVSLGSDVGGPSWSNGNSFTWTKNESSGETNGSANSQSVSLSSSTVGCYENVAVYEDTIFHTFVFQQPSGNNSCN